MTNQITIKSRSAITASPDILALVGQWHTTLDRRSGSGELSINTAMAYKRGFAKLLAWLDTTGAASFDSDTLRDWLADLRRQGYKPGTINTWLAGPRDFFAWAVSVGIAPTNPAAGVKSASRRGTTKTHKRDALTRDEARRLLASVDRTTPQGKRDAAILYLFLYTGARTVELHRADFADLQTKGDQTVLMIQAKGHQDRDLYKVIPPAALDVLYDWKTARGSQPGALFISLSDRSNGDRLSLRAIRGIVKGYFAKAGITGAKSTHSLRHTAITSAIRNGAKIQAVQAMAGHQSIETTMIYYHETDRLTDPAENFINYAPA